MCGAGLIVEEESGLYEKTRFLAPFFPYKPGGKNMNLMEMRLNHYDEMLAAARGDIPANTLVHGGRILNVALPGRISAPLGLKDSSSDG